jgi:U3 small nucleolar RNA-associated protein 12
VNLNGETQPEASAVNKQTTETLMAGERIVEALDLADKERELFESYYNDMSKLPEDDAMRMQAPPRNPVLAAYDMEPDQYVLMVIEKIQSTALHDALLTLPFGKVMALMYYLNIWAQKVDTLLTRSRRCAHSRFLRISILFSFPESSSSCSEPTITRLPLIALCEQRSYH